MDFSAILRILDRKFSIISQNMRNDVQLFSTASISGDCQEQDGILYYTNLLCTMNIVSLHGSFIWCGREPENLEALQANWIQVREEDFDLVIREVNTVFLNEYKSQSLHLRMANILMSGKGLPALVNEAAKCLDTTIVVIDISGKIISRSKIFKIKDPFWQESIERGFCPPYFINHLRDVRTEQPVEREDEAILRHCLDTNTFYLAKRIYISGELYGYVFFLQMNDQFSAFADSVLNTITRAVLQQQNGVSADSVKSTFYSNLIIDIFKGLSSEQIKARIFAGEMEFPSRMCVAAIRPRFFQGEKYFQDKLPRILQQEFPKDHMVHYQKMAIVVLSVSSSIQDAFEEIKLKLQGIAAHEHLCIGISNPFSKVTSMNHYYVQAVHTIDLANRLDLQGDVFFYKDLALYDLIKNDSAHNNVGFYCHPALAELLEYDSETGNQLHSTLRSLVRNGFNNTITAQELFLHRNTLAYRKQKIISLTGIDLDDFNTQFMLKYSFMIEEFKEKYASVSTFL